MIQILVIEDDPTQRLLTCAVLRSAGYAVVEATDGVAGLESVVLAPPDLIVCDVMMPGLNGFQLIDALKQQPEFSTIPVIMLTAMSARSHVRVGMTSGADDYLIKPFRAAELRQSVEALLAKREQQRREFVRAVGPKLSTALEKQKDELTLRYEKRLTQELNERWNGQPGDQPDIYYDNAVVVSADIFGLVLNYFPSGKSASEAIRRVYQIASDASYLFGAAHLVPSGSDLLAIFPYPVEPIGPSPELLAARSALGLQKTVRSAFEALASAPNEACASRPELTISLYSGPVQLIQIRDPLHGGEGLTLASGEAVCCARAIADKARACGWAMSSSKAFAAVVSDEVSSGGSALVSRGHPHPSFDMVQLLATEQP